METEAFSNNQLQCFTILELANNLLQLFTILEMANNLLYFFTILEFRPDHMLKRYLCRFCEITVFTRKRSSLARKVSLHETFRSKKGIFEDSGSF